jgi:hypothetical protein
VDDRPPKVDPPGTTGNLSGFWILVKGILFLGLSLMASALLILSDPTLRTTFLVGVAVWAGARFYYCAFYVIEHYVDRTYRFAGLWSFFVWVVRRRKGDC